MGGVLRLIIVLPCILAKLLTKSDSLTCDSTAFSDFLSTAFNRSPKASEASLSKDKANCEVWEQEEGEFVTIACCVTRSPKNEQVCNYERTKEHEKVSRDHTQTQITPTLMLGAVLMASHALDSAEAALLGTARSNAARSACESVSKARRRKKVQERGIKATSKISLQISTSWSMHLNQCKCCCHY